MSPLNAMTNKPDGKRGEVAGMALRFFGSIVCGVALVLAFVGAATLYNPYDPVDTWDDVWRFTLRAVIR